MDNKFKRITVVALIITGFIGVCINWYVNTKHFVKKRIEIQLESRYGVEFSITEIEEEKEEKDEEKNEEKNEGRYSFVGQTEDSVFVMGYCDKRGKLLRESYVHYYYAPELNKKLEEKIGKCFDECFIVRNCIDGYSCEAALESLDVDRTETFEDYMKCYKATPIMFDVYLKDDVTDEQLQQAMDIMVDEKTSYWIDFYRVSDDTYSGLKKANRQCYFLASENLEYILENGDFKDSTEIQVLFYEPRKHADARIDLEYGVCRIKNEEDKDEE